MTTQAYPLAWPPGWPRRNSNDREDSRYRFKGADGPVTFDRARRMLMEELAKLRASDVVLSTNIRLRGDGAPLASEAARRIDDPGVAVYFTLKKRPMVMASDRYDAPSANMRSIGLAIEAMRQLERHGGGAMMERAFAGFAALPAPTQGRPWREVLGFGGGKYRDLPATREVIQKIYIERAKEAGSSEGAPSLYELNAARDQAFEEIKK